MGQTQNVGTANVRKSQARQTVASTLNGTVPPRRTRNADVRPREYLTPKEVHKLIKAARARGR